VSGGTGQQPSRLLAGVPAGEGSETTGRGWYGQVTKKEPAGRGIGSRSFPSYRGSKGTPPSGPCGGKGKPVDRTVGGTHGGCTETQNRVNETTTDSKTGRREMLRQRVNDGDRLAKLSTEEPDALIAHVRICGGPARVTSRSLPDQCYIRPSAALMRPTALLTVLYG
jgi:hypothetical protein